MNENTLLVINGVPLSPYAVRGLTQTLQPIQNAIAPQRTINGELLNVSGPQFQKFASEISGTDMRPPALAAVWPGDVVTVDCLTVLSYLTATDAEPVRTPVPGSEFTEGDFTFYRPRLVMMVMSWNQSEAEYDAAITWSLQLEEI